MNHGADRNVSPPGNSDPGVSPRERLGSSLLFEMCPTVSPENKPQEPMNNSNNLINVQKTKEATP